jgi:hypothetical protein
LELAKIRGLCVMKKINAICGVSQKAIGQLLFILLRTSALSANDILSGNRQSLARIQNKFGHQNSISSMENGIFISPLPTGKTRITEHSFFSPRQMTHWGHINYTVPSRPVSPLMKTFGQLI